MPAPLPAPVLANLDEFTDAVDLFFSRLAAVGWGSLTLGLVLFAANLVLRSRGAFNVLRAAYPEERFRWLEVGGAYVAGYGANAVFPARPGAVVRLFLLRRSIPGSSYPTLGATLLVESIFDTAMSALILVYAFSQGIFPKPPSFDELRAFDHSFFAAHPRFTLFLVTALAILALVAFAFASRHVQAFWTRVRQGFAILRQPGRYLRQVAALQLAGWLARFASFWCMLEAFGIGGSVRNVLLVLAVSAVSSLVPLTPGGAGVQQALLVKVFAGTAGGATVAAYSVGQQLATAAFAFVLGLGAIVGIFRLRSFRQVIRAGRHDQAAPSEGS